MEPLLVPQIGETIPGRKQLFQAFHHLFTGGASALFTASLVQTWSRQLGKAAVQALKLH